MVFLMSISSTLRSKNSELDRDNQRELESVRLRADGARKEAEEAKARATGFQLDIAKANERAALAERETAEIKLRLAPRRLTKSETAKFVADLTQFAGARIGVIRLGDSEARVYADDIGALFRKAGWQIEWTDAGIMAPPRYGLQCDVDERTLAGKKLASLLKRLPNASVKTGFREGLTASILVGLKSPP
jgi:hypothetical protein